MKCTRYPGWRALALLVVALAGVAAADEPPAFDVPAWAFPAYTHPPPDGEPDAVVKLRVPGSRVAYTRAELENFHAAPDWFPDRHPPMPASVAVGREPDTFACAYCHLPDGTGRPENAALAGLPADYIRAQVAAMRDHTRRRAWTKPGRTSGLMQQVAESATDAEIAEAARYYAALPMRRKVRIVETTRVPKSEEVRFIYLAATGGGDEPLGERLIEMPVDRDRHELRDPTVTYLANVPPGSLARGRALATTGARGTTAACVSCHGRGLRGSGVTGPGAGPPLAGRSPSYLLRQLLAFRTGTRSAPAGLPMQAMAAQLSLRDMLAVSAYAGSLPP